MKKILISLLLILSSTLSFGVVDGIDKLIQLVNGEKQEKSRWFQFKKQLKDAEFDLMNRQHANKYDLRIKYLARLKSEGVSDKWAQDKFAEEVALQDRHLEEWKKLCDDYHMVGDQMYRDAKTKLNLLNQSTGMGMGVGGYGKGYGYGTHEGATLMEKLGKVLETLKANMPTYRA